MTAGVQVFPAEHCTVARWQTFFFHFTRDFNVFNAKTLFSLRVQKIRESAEFVWNIAKLGDELGCRS